VQQDLLAPLVLQAQPAHKVFKASQVNLDLLVPQVLQVLKEKEVLPVLQEQPEQLDLPVLRGLMAWMERRFLMEQ
jgi:hypothetical protein